MQKYLKPPPTYLFDVSNSYLPSYQIPSAPPWPWNEGRLHEDLLSERQEQRCTGNPLMNWKKQHVFHSGFWSKLQTWASKIRLWRNKIGAILECFWRSSYIFDVSFNVSFHFWIVSSFPFSPPFQVPSLKKMERFPKPPHRQIRWILLGLVPRYVSAWSFIAQEDGEKNWSTKKHFGQNW